MERECSSECKPLTGTEVDAIVSLRVAPHAGGATRLTDM